MQHTGGGGYGGSSGGGSYGGNRFGGGDRSQGYGGQGGRSFMTMAAPVALRIVAAAPRPTMANRFLAAAPQLLSLARRFL